jgi:hypothetical protein
MVKNLVQTQKMCYDSKMKEEKRQRGQYYTRGNPFKVAAFVAWCQSIPKFNERIFVEPFAGANNIPKSIREMGFTNTWSAYDISPSKENTCEDIVVKKSDTLDKSFNYKKAGGDVVITNPPYLAKNSATRRGLKFPTTDESDLYLYSLVKILDGVPYAAVIIPESFLTQSRFHDRLYAVVSLKESHFNDTEHPVCLALFVPKESAKNENFEIWSENEKIGSWKTLQDESKKFNAIESDKENVSISFNSKGGQIGLWACDNLSEESIKFVSGDLIKDKDVKISSRAISKISIEIKNGLPKSLTKDELSKVIEYANATLKDYRNKTQDVFLTAFKGLRKDLKYRRRIDFKTAKSILYVAAKNALQSRIE